MCCRRGRLFFIGIVLFCMVAQFSFAQEAALKRQGWSVLRHSDAPKTSVRSAAGERIRFSETLPDGEITIVNFWATWCAPCVEELPDLQRLGDALQETGVNIILINSQEKPRETEAFLERLGVTLTSYYDTRGKLGNKFGARGLPVSFLIDGRKQVFARYVGLFPWNSDAFIDALMQIR